MLNLLKMFKKEKKILLESGLNKEVVEGFLNKIEDIVCIVDSEHKIEYINKKEMENEYSFLLELIGCDQNKELYNEILEYVKKYGYYSKDIKVVKKNKIINMYISIYCIQTVDKYIIYIKDTDKYFKNENILKEKLSKSNEELRNKELFVANLSHEIKTPINIIVAMTYFLKSTKLDQMQSEYLERLEGASDLLTELVNNILNVAKSDKVVNSINSKEVFVLKDLVDKVFNIFKDELENKNIPWSIEADFDMNIEVYEDKTRMEQILINLISNAVKYTEKGYIEVVINKVRENFDSYCIRFCVKDTGIGIKKEDTIKIFKEFEQNQDPTIKEREGFGLGLPLVKKIIESMGGKIWVESSFGLGSKFFFELNLSKNVNQFNQFKVEEEKQEDNQYDVETMISNKVLIVDDNSIINEITNKVLSEIGIECDIAKDGMEAIKKVEKKGLNYYALILMDIHMPKYNGYDISRIMKEELKVKTPIVALTATNITEKVVEENKKYISSYIQKPVKPEELKKTVKEIIKNNNTKLQNNKRKETVLFIADKIKNWEILENLSNVFNVICTLNEKDINIILETKKIAAIIVDTTEQEQIKYNKNGNILLYLKHEKVAGNQNNMILCDENGYMKKIEDINIIGYVLAEILKKNNREKTLNNEIEEKKSEISNIYKYLYDSLVNLTSIRSKETGAHLMRTKEYMKVMLEEYERYYKTGEFESKEKIENIGIAATLHDIGKNGIPDNVLNKPGRLNDEEYELIKNHVTIAYQILENTYSDKISSDVLNYAKEITLHHHEKYDGSGYPDELKGNEINILSRIMAVIDVYDALVNDRVYKKAISYEETEEYIIANSGKNFDPKVVNVFINVKDKLRNINEQYKD